MSQITNEPLNSKEVNVFGKGEREKKGTSGETHCETETDTND